MSNLPITSRIKRSPLLKQAAGAINPDDPKPLTVGGTIKGEPKITTETITTQGKLTGKKDKKQMSNEQWAEYLKNETPEQKARRTKREINEGLREPDKKETKTTATPGEDSSWEETLKVKTTGDVFQPWETRQMSRSIKKEQRDIRRDKIKEARANGTLTPELRKQFRAEEAKAEKEEHQSMADRAKAARGSGKKGGSNDVATGERNATLSDVGGINEQTTYLNRQHGTEDSSGQNNTTTSNTTGQNNTTTSNTTEENNTATDTTAEDKRDSGVKMKPSAFKMYGKSPAVKTLQGNQNKLPQHLQDAIKAAPGKMKAPLKKGYFKK